MSQEHTKEPWTAVGAWVEHEDNDIADICTCSIEALGQQKMNRSYAEECANAKRIAACVNACSGIPTDMLEQVGTIVTNGALPHRILTKQRDELLEALKDLHATCQLALAGKNGTQFANFESRHGTFVEASRAMEKAEIAIAKAEAA